MKKLMLFFIFTLVSFANIGTIMVADGNAQIKRSAHLVSVTNGMDIQKGDEIITQKKTRVQVMLNDDTVITIGPNSSYAFIDYMFDGSKKSTIQMQANRGFFRSVTGKIGKIAPERFKVKTKLATIGIRGTDFSAQLGKNTASYICNRGEITLKYANLQKSIVAGNKMLLHLDGLTVKELTQAAINGNANAKAILKEHAEQIKLDASAIANINEKKMDAQKIKFNCDAN